MGDPSPKVSGHLKKVMDFKRRSIKPSPSVFLAPIGEGINGCWFIYI